MRITGGAAGTAHGHGVAGSHLVILFDGNPAGAISGAVAGTAATGDRVTVVHSGARAADAARLIAVLRDIAPHAPVAAVDCGNATSLPDFQARYAQIPLATPYRLDYTAGSRVQAVAAIWRHLDDHAGGGHDRRWYADNLSRRLLRDGPTGEGIGTVDVPAGRVTLSRLARLEGFDLVSGTGPVTLRAGVDPGHAREILDRLRVRLLDRSRSAGVDRARTATAQHLASCFHGIPGDLAARWSGLDWGGVKGAATELLVAGAVAFGLHDSPESDYEVLAGVTARMTGTAPDSPLAAEFDVVVRVGTTVWVIESKAGPRNAAAKFADRETHARMVFGAEVRVVMVTGRAPFRSERSYEQRLDDLERRWNRPVPTRERVWLFELTDRADYRALFHLTTHDSQSRVRTDLPDSDPAHDDAVESGDASPVDLLICGAADPGGIRPVVGELQPRSIGWLALPRTPAPTVVADRIETIIMPRLNAATAYRAARVLRPAVISMTSGPKHVLAGFVRYTHAHPGTTLIHLDRPTEGGNGSVWLGAPAAGWANRERTFVENWPGLLAAAGFRPVADSDRSHPAVDHVVDEARTRGLAVWADPDRPRASDPASGQVAHLLLSGEHATVSVSVVLTPRAAAGVAKASALDFESRVEAVVGPQNRNVVVVPAGFLTGSEPDGAAPLPAGTRLAADRRGERLAGARSVGHPRRSLPGGRAGPDVDRLGRPIDEQRG